MKIPERKLGKPQILIDREEAMKANSKLTRHEAMVESIVKKDKKEKKK